MIEIFKYSIKKKKNNYKKKLKTDILISYFSIACGHTANDRYSRHVTVVALNDPNF